VVQSRISDMGVSYDKITNSTDQGSDNIGNGGSREY